MSWIRPHEEEPSHPEFVIAWVLTGTVRDASKILRRLGYVRMKPKRVYRWGLHLWASGVNLPQRARPT